MNSNYKHYFKRQYGLKESQLPPSIVERDSFPGIDPEELEMGAEDEKDEHGMSPEKAQQTAAQHLKEPDQQHYYSGMEKAKRQGMLKDMLMGKTPPAINQLTSPTAISIPIIGATVRGSCTGGLPSGADQGSNNITPSNFGGYTPIPTDQANSRLIDKTPTNSQINATTPINKNPDTIVEPHPHQIQNDAGEAPQSVTGASTDSDNSITLKSASPKALDIDVSEKKKEENHEFEPTADQNPESTSPNKEGDREGSLNETFARHKKLMLSSFGVNRENKPVVVVEEKKKVCLINESIKYSAPFEKMRGLADLGERKVSSNGLWEGVGASEPFNTNWKMDSEKAGMVKVDEFSKKGLVNIGEDGKWMQKASSPKTKGALHKDLGVPEDKKIPTEKLESLKKMLHTKSQSEAGLTEKELKLSRRVNAALNMRNANKQ